MSGFTNRKNWLSGLLTVSLAVIPTCTITAEENSKIVDQYIIVDLGACFLVSESDTAESVSKRSCQQKKRVEVDLILMLCCFLFRRVWIKKNIV